MSYFPRNSHEGITKLDLDLGVARYPYFVGENPSTAFVSQVLATARPNRVAIVADENVADVFGMMYEAAFINAGVQVVALTVPAGETCKTWAVAGELLDALAGAHIERGDCIVALGGGAVSDLAGFAAHTYQRGISFAIVATTLLAMVDASVGGKVAVNLPQAKNLAGAFQHPVAVCADLRALKSLPELEFQSGLAEVAKTAFIEGEEFTKYLEENSEQICLQNAEVLTELILRCVEFKAIVVAGDPHDHGARECLNYGHTLGHAIEHELGYGEILHGVAIGEGMRFAAKVASIVAESSPEVALRQNSLLDALNIPRIEKRLDTLSMLAAIKHDKKVRTNTIRMMLLTRIGHWQVEEVSDEIVSEVLRSLKEMSE